MVGDPIKGFDAYMIHINPKLTMQYNSQEGEEIDLIRLEDSLSEIMKASVQRITGKYIQEVHAVSLPVSDIDLTIQTTNSLGNQQICSVQLIERIRSYTVKKYVDRTHDPFVLSSVHDFRNSFMDRKVLLSDYLAYRYPTNQDAYIDFMKLHGII